MDQLKLKCDVCEVTMTPVEVPVNDNDEWFCPNCKADESALMLGTVDDHGVFTPAPKEEVR